jgi:hypothetical protein
MLASLPTLGTCSDFRFSNFHAPVRHIPFGHRFVSSNACPVSSKLFRLDRIIGHPPETASISFDPPRSISWITVSFTDSPFFSISYVIRE